MTYTENIVCIIWFIGSIKINDVPYPIFPEIETIQTELDRKNLLI